MKELKEEYHNQNFQNKLKRILGIFYQSQNLKKMTPEEKIKLSETRVFKAVFPNTNNHYDTLFGGTAMQMMD